MADEKMTLYWYPTYRSVRNIWLIKELGVEKDFEFKLHKPNDDPAADAEYRKNVHPHGTIPALVIPGVSTMLESGAICMYLADRYGKCVPQLKFRSEYYDFIIYGNATLDALLEISYEYWEDGVRDEKTEKRKNNLFNTCMEYLSEKLKDRKFLCGKEFTAADCVVGFDLYYIELISKVQDVYKDYPTVKQYFESLKSREAFQATTAMTEAK